MTWDLGAPLLIVIASVPRLVLGLEGGGGLTHSSERVVLTLTWAGTRKEEASCLSSLPRGGERGGRALFISGEPGIATLALSLRTCCRRRRAEKRCCAKFRSQMHDKVEGGGGMVH